MSERLASPKKSWFQGSSQNSTRLQRRGSSGAQPLLNGNEFDDLRRAMSPSPSHVGEGHEIPPPPRAVHPAFRSRATRDISTGRTRQRKTGSNLKIVQRQESGTMYKASNAAPRPAIPQEPVTVMADRPQYSLPLPTNWNQSHDELICMCDAKGLTLAENIQKLRSVYPELVHVIVSPAMIDKRLQMLDQIADVDYFKRGLPSHAESRTEEDKKMNEELALAKAASVERRVKGKSAIACANPPAISPAAGGVKIDASIGGKENLRVTEKGKARESTSMMDGTTFVEDDMQIEQARNSIKGETKVHKPIMTKATGVRTPSLGPVETAAFDTGYVSYRTPTNAP